MVTFALPGDNDAEATTSTPRSRPPLPFAKRAYASSPYSSASRRMGTPQSASRKNLITRDEVPASSLGRSYQASSNLFRASTISDSPPSTSFSPRLSQTPKQKLFAPGATPEPTRVQREFTAQPTPRGVASRAKEKELFSVRIASPPRELTGEALTRKVPKDWDPRGSIYADQFLGHLCPPEFDDEQRRQFFCILDLRRLKFAADEIFCKKGWKLNVLNFAKEFEKSRSIILLHYGLFEFQNVKPSKEVIKKWRRDHGLPALEDDDEDESTPSKPVSTKKKRKASDDDSADSQSANNGKRRAMEKDDHEQPVTSISTPVPTKNKRKASVSDDVESQPASKIQKPSSASRSLFEKAASKASASPSAASTNLFSQKPSSSLMQSVLKNNAKTDAAQQPSNIFGHLSDSGSAKASGQDADESDNDSEPESQDDEPSDEPKAKRPAIASVAETGTSSDAGTRESTPGRSLFDRVTKGDDGQPVRAEAPVAGLSKDQTWNPSTTPIKFASSATSVPAGTSASSLFGGSGFKPAGTSSFAPQSGSTSSNLFGATKADKAEEQKSEEKSNGDAAKDDGESDKENDSHPNEAKPTQPPASLFPSKPAEQPKESEPAKPATSLFGNSTAPTSTSAANIFSSANKPADSASAAPVMQSSTLFGAKPSEPAKPTSTLFGTQPASQPASNLFGAKPSEPEKPVTNLFATKPAESGTPSASLFGAKTSEPEKPATSLFAAKPTESGTPSSSLFGAKPAQTETSASPLFGAKSAEPEKAAASPLFGATPSEPQKADSKEADKAKPAASLFSQANAATGSNLFGNNTSSTPSPAPTFSFGAPAKTNGAQPAANSLFGAPKSPPAAAGPGSMFDGSPMKQDDRSPAKPLFGSGNNASSNPIFGNASQGAPSANIFGGGSNAPANNAAPSTNMFGGNNNNSSSGAGFNFNFGGGSGASSGGFNNPFASGNSQPGASAAPSTGGMFNFGGAAPAAPSPAPSTGGAFQFGGSSNTGNSTPSGGVFGANQSNGTPAFGGSSAPSSGPVMFGGASSQPQQNPNSAAAFLQPPSGGFSTGTNTPSVLGGGSSLATTPARGTPEPSSQAEGTKAADDEEGEKHEQINLTDNAEEGEDTLHEVRAKVLKYVTPDKTEGDDKPKSKSPWSTQGVGPLRLLKNKETESVRLLLRAEPRGNVAMNRAVLPDFTYAADQKYVKVTTSNEGGDGLETWMIQVKTKELATELAEALEKNKSANKK